MYLLFSICFHAKTLESSEATLLKD